jgi:hypothetical protein
MRARIICFAAVTAGLLVAAAPASAGTECRYQDDSCETITSPWVAVPGGTVNAPGQAGYSIQCPAAHYAAGFDWETQNVDDVYLDLPPGNWAGYPPVFLLQNMDDSPGTAQIDLGCIPTPAGSRAAPNERGATIRLGERRVRAGRRLVATHACAAGEEAISGGGAIVFETRLPPSRRLLNGQTLTIRHTSTGVRAIVETEDYVGDDERVVLHMYAVCV